MIEASTGGNVLNQPPLTLWLAEVDYTWLIVFSHLIQPLLHPLKILRGVLAIDESVVGMECVGDYFAVAVGYHFTEGHEWDAALSSEHERMVEGGEGYATSDRVVDDVLTGVWAFQADLDLDTFCFGNELGHELCEVLGVPLKREAECAVWSGNGGREVDGVITHGQVVFNTASEFLNFVGRLQLGVSTLRRFTFFILVFIEKRFGLRPVLVLFLFV